MDIPIIAYWMGRPLNEMPRDELEREFVAAHRRIRELEQELCDNSVARMHDLATMAKRRLRDKHPLLEALSLLAPR